MAMERLVQEISELTPQDRAELLRRLGPGPADTTKVADNSAPFNKGAKPSGQDPRAAFLRANCSIISERLNERKYTT